MSKKVWIDAGLIGATDLPKELRESSEGMKKIPKSPKVERKYNENKSEIKRRY